MSRVRQKCDEAREQVLERRRASRSSGIAIPKSRQSSSTNLSELMGATTTQDGGGGAGVAGTATTATAGGAGGCGENTQGDDADDTLQCMQSHRGHMRLCLM